jgi:hypothetical protein
MAEKPITVQSTVPSTQRTENEHRQAYGTAKTEDLRDSGLWRLILPAFVFVLCLALVAIPMIILIWLLVNALNAGSGLVWLWITMIVLILIVVGVIISGLSRTFFTQAENYTHIGQ